MGLKLARTACLTLAVAVTSSGLLGCADSETTPAPPNVAGPAKRAGAVVERLETALRRRDFETICDDLLTPAARTRAGGRRCVATMADSAEGLLRPRIRPLSIRIVGSRAEVRVRTEASGQAAIEETLELDRTGGRYRISALAR